MTDQAQVTVVICTYNRAHRLPDAVAAVLAQRTEVAFEVLVVDDGSSDGTPQVRLPDGVRVVRQEPNQGIGAARARALAEVRTPYLAFTDDDCTVAPDWLDLLWQASLREPEAACWGGHTTLAPVAKLIDRYSVANNPFTPLSLELERSAAPAYRLGLYLKNNLDPRVPGPGPVYSLGTGNILLRVADLRAVGGFDARFTESGEDEEMFRRLRESGRVLWYEPRAIVVHDNVGSVRRVQLRAYLYGRAKARLVARGMTRTPTLFPLPVLMAATAPWALRRPGRAAAWLAAPALAYPRWALRAARSGSAEPLTYAYLQFAEEAANTVGWVSYGVDLVRGRAARVD